MREEHMIDYGDSELAWSDVKITIERKILESRARRILEVGAGANPLFPEEFLNRHGLSYTAIDISETELSKAPACYQKIVADICSDDLNICEQFDFIFSRMLAEHVPDGVAFHRNVFRLLAPGGLAFHFFPTLWALPFIVNRLLPERLAESLLHAIQNGRERGGNLAKFPAFYNLCRGPMPSQIRRLESMGYKIESYIGFYGHRGYYLKFPYILKIHDAISKWLIAHPRPWLTSFAYLTLRKPR